KGESLSSNGVVEFTYTSNNVEGTELVKVSAHNKALGFIESNTLLDNTIIESDLRDIDIKVKETASSIAINLKNPQISFSYSTMKFVEPPLPRPVDDLGAQVD